MKSIKGKSKFFLGIDVGHTVVKVAAYSQDGKELAISGKRVRTLVPHSGWQQTPCNGLWNQTKRAIGEAVQKVHPKSIRGIGFCGAGNGFFPLDKNHRPVYDGIPPTDMRARGIIERLKKEGKFERLFQILGMPPIPACTPVLFKWFKENDKNTYDRIKSVLSCKDFIRFELTNELATEISDACFGLTNVKTQSYDAEIFELLGVKEKFETLPELKDNSYDLAGYTTEEVGKETGLKKGTPVVCGAHDAACNTLGVGAIENNAVCTGGGTWSINLMVVDKPVIDPMWSCESFVKKSLWLLEGSSPTSTTSLDWFIENFCDTEKRKAKRKSIYDICEEEIRDRKTCVVYHPYLLGLPWGYPYQSNATGAFLGITKESSKIDILRALYEGVAFIHKLHIEQYERIGIGDIRFTGGAAKSKLWVQMLADILNRKVEIIDKEETGCFGAACLAALGVGELKNLEEVTKLIHVVGTYYPNESNRKKYAYQEKYEIFKRSSDLFGEIWDDLENLRKEIFSMEGNNGS